MKYVMRAGTLYRNDTVLAKIKGAFTGPEKRYILQTEQCLCARIY